MIKMLIADDEPLVCVGIQSMLQWEEHGIEIVGTARNGKIAEEMIEQLRPEIVISDIKMPVKTGLELAESCAEKYGRIPLFIFLTSYEEFDFIKKAMHLQVVDYLIKLELTPDSLSAAVQKALNILERYKKISSEMQDSQISLPVLREKFFIRLYSNLFDNDEQYERQKKDLDIKFTSSSYIAAYCEISRESSSNVDNDQLISLYTGTIQMARETLGKTKSYYITVLDMRHFVITFCLDGDYVQCRQIIERALNRTRSAVHSYFNVQLKAAVGNIVNDPRNLSESYTAATHFFNDVSDENPIAFFEEANSEKYHKMIIGKVQKFIDDNLGMRLTLSLVAETFNFSANYLSQLFSKYSGESFVEYVSSARVAEAKKMLACGEGHIYEIAQKLGFDNAFYFSKVFKKYEGVSPRDYLKAIEAQQRDSKPIN
ncbi:MAG: helix-turn-helix domain-containing protein [Clostridiaceae bacterium]|nr:helix-turn-helix domain-containing protein [Clostridiaceae bacterium]